MDTTQVMHCTMTLARFLETIEKKIGAFEGRDAEELSALEKTQTQQQKNMEHVFELLEEQRNIMLEEMSERKKIYERFFNLLDAFKTQLKQLKKEHKNSSNINQDEFEERVRQAVIKETLEALEEDLQREVSEKIVEVKKSFTEKQTAMEEKIENLEMVHEKTLETLDREIDLVVAENLKEIRSKLEDLDDEVDRIVSENLEEIRSDIVSNKQNITKCADTIATSVEILDVLKTTFDNLKEQISKLTQEPTTTSEEFEQKMQSEIQKQIKSLLTDLNQKVQKHIDQTTTKFQKQDAKLTTQEVLDNTFKERLNRIETKLPSNTDFREIIEAQTRKFLEEHPELLKPSSKLSTEVESLTNSYAVMSNRVEKLEATATKFADDRAIKRMQEKYDNLETKYKELEAQVKELSETQTNA